jgi:integrase
MRLTPATIRALTLPLETRERIYFDDDVPGFGVRLRVGGSKRYVVQYAVGGRTRRVVLGPVSVLELGTARSAAKDLLARVRLGADPAGEKVAGRAAAAETFGRILPAFLARQRARLRPRPMTEVVRHLEKHAKPLHARPLATIDRRSVAALINAVAVASGPTAAKHLRQTLSAFFRWAIGEGLLEASPTAFTNPPAVNPPRSRLLSDRELPLIWRGASGTDRYSTIIKPQMLTSARRSEIADLRWSSEVDLDAATITLPPGRTKNANPHTIMLPRQAVAILAELARDGETVFGGVDGRGYQSWSAAKRKLDARITTLNGGTALEPWTPHDFRRATSTWLHEMGTDHLVVEAILGHAAGQSAVARTYNLAQHFEARRRAIQRWADHITNLVEGEKPAATVVTLRG